MAKFHVSVVNKWPTRGATIEWGDQVVFLPVGAERDFDISEPLTATVLGGTEDYMITPEWTIGEKIRNPNGSTTSKGSQKRSQVITITPEENITYSLRCSYAFNLIRITRSVLYMDYGKQSEENLQVSVAGQTKKLTLRIPEEVPTKEGFSFVGWSDVQYREHSGSFSVEIDPDTGLSVSIPGYSPILDATDVVYRPGDEVTVDYVAAALNIPTKGTFPHVGAVFVPRGNLRTYIVHNGEMRPVTPFIVKDGKWTVYRSALGLQGIFEQEKTSAVFSGVLGFARLGFMRLGVNANVEKLDAPVIRLERDDLPKLDAPVITLEQDRLNAPAIYIESTDPTERLATPVIYIYTDKLATPVIELKEV